MSNHINAFQVPRKKCRNMGTQTVAKTASKETQTQDIITLDGRILLATRKSNPISFFLNNEKKRHYFTGLDETQRWALWNFLGEAKDRLKMINMKHDTFSGELTCMTVECQFLLTLMVLRRNKKFEELRIVYEIANGTISSIFKTWIMFMFKKFKDVEKRMFLQRKQLFQPLPRSFRNNVLKDVRCVIDCTEIRVQSSRNYRQQGNIYSSYKHVTTAKVLIATVPSGACCFVSDCFEGAISDRAITLDCGFIDYLETNDIVLADRGFNVDDHVRAKGAFLVTPSYMRGRDYLPLDESRLSRIVARARIHIERFNQRFKIFEFVQGVIPRIHFPMISQIVYVCCMLGNFSPLLNK